MTTVSPPENQFFYIESEATILQVVERAVLAVSYNSTEPGADIIIWPMERTNAQSQLWSMTDDGHIISQLSGCAIAWDDSQGRIVTANVGDPEWPYQLWNVTDDGHIVNQAVDGSLLTVCKYTDGNTGATLAPSSIFYPGLQSWKLLAPIYTGSATVPNWVYFQSALQDYAGQNCVFNVDANRTDPGTPVIVWPLTTDSSNVSNELWQVTPDGRILSAQGNNLVLTLGNPWNDNEGYYVTVDVQEDPLPLRQTWDLSAPNQIRNALTGYALCPAGANAGPVTLGDGDPIVAAPGDTDSASYTWYTVAPSPTLLQTVLAQQPVPFEEFQGDQGEAYDYIMGQLGVPLRTEYYNLNADLDAYDNAINNMSPPDDLRDAWGPVTDRLSLEILYANTTRYLFSNYTNFQNTLFGTDGATLNQLIADAGLTQGENETNVGGIIFSVFEGLLYTLLCAVPGVGEAEISVGGIVGNLMETGVNTALAASGSDAISPDPFQVAVSKLWNQLNGNYQALLGAMGTMETTILKDWGMLQSVYPLAAKPGGPLFWDPKLTSELVEAATPGYQTAVMKMLLPAKYCIFTDTGFFTPVNPPPWALWQPDPSSERRFWIAEPDHWSNYPAEQTMQSDIWGTGVKPDDFFRSAAGWQFVINSHDGLGDFYITFTNLTQNMLRLTSSASSANPVDYFQNGDYIGPGQSCVIGVGQFATVTFQVIDCNGPQDQVGEFTASWHESQVNLGNTSAGYQFTSLNIQTAGTQFGLAQIPVATT